MEALNQQLDAVKLGSIPGHGAQQDNRVEGDGNGSLEGMEITLDAIKSNDNIYNTIDVEVSQ